MSFWKWKRAGHLWQGRFLSYCLYDDAHFWMVAKYIERNPIKANMVRDLGDYRYQSFFQWKHKEDYFKLLENSMIFNMTPKIINKDGETKVLTKRLETFFEKDKDINRNENIEKAYVYGYSKTEIASFVGLSAKSVWKIQKLYS